MDKYTADLAGELATANLGVVHAEEIRKEVLSKLRNVAYYRRNDGKPGQVLYIETVKGTVKYRPRPDVPDEAEFIEVMKPDK